MNSRMGSWAVSFSSYWLCKRSMAYPFSAYMRDFVPINVNGVFWQVGLSGGPLQCRVHAAQYPMPEIV